jgi:hypothetical protein
MQTRLRGALIMFLLGPFSVQTGQAAMATPGQFAVSESGAATYSIPLAVPPGTSGLAPKLALSYSSQAGNGMLGMGWSMSGLSIISRCPRTLPQDGVRGSVTLNSDDRFCLDGQRLMAVSGTYGNGGTEYRTEREGFARIVSYGSAGNGPAWFKVWTKSGQIMEYGNTEDSRIEAQGNVTAVLWALNRVADTKSNYFTVTYIEENVNGTFYPQRIDYTGNAAAGLASNNSVQFVYEAKPDMEQRYVAPNSSSRQTVRLTAARTYSGANLVKEYRVSYALSVSTQRSRATSIRECDGANVCLPSISLTWQDGNATMTEIPSLSNLGAGYGYTNQDRFPVLIGDWNGDGKTDIGRVIENGIYFYASQGTQFIPYSFLSAFSPAQGYTSSDRYPIITGDWNGDGWTDIARVVGHGVYFYLSTSGGMVPYSLLANFSPDWGYTSMDRLPLVTGDWNGDGRTDIARVTEAGIYFYVANGGSGFTFHQSLMALSPAQGLVSASTHPIFTGDWNGDGKTDIARLVDGGVYFYVGTDIAFVPHHFLANFSPTQGFSNQDRHPFVFGDWNGDGKTDIGRIGEGGLYTYLSTGTTFASLTTFANLAPAQGFTSAASLPLITGDWNGDGKTDIARFSEGGLGFFRSDGSTFTGTWTLADISIAQGFSNAGTYPVVVGDWNGKGKTGVARFASGVRPFIPGSENLDLLTAIGSEIGSDITIGYKPLTDASVYSKDAGASYPLADVQPAMFVVSSAASANGAGGTLTSSYSYGGMRVEVGGRGWLGFRWQQSVQAETGMTARTEFRQDWPYTGLVSLAKKTLSGSGNGGLLSQVTNTYGCTDFVSGSGCTVAAGRRYFPYVSQGEETGYDLNGSALPTITTTSQYDSYGNPTQIVVGTGDGYSKTTTNTYTNDAANWFLGRLTRATVTSTTP